MSFFQACGVENKKAKLLHLAERRFIPSPGDVSLASCSPAELASV